MRLITVSARPKRPGCTATSQGGRRLAPRDHPVAQPGADGAADEVAGEHDQAEVEPVAERPGTTCAKEAATRATASAASQYAVTFEVPLPRWTTEIQPMQKPSSKRADQPAIWNETR